MKLLVSNRSEIACRIFQSCREMGIRTVAIFAPGDQEARHLTYADELYEVPSYLDVEAIVAVAKKRNVNLIHPGYGFLSERPMFARAVEEAGITFVGPRAETMELMGEKIAAKEVAEKAGVPTLPWARVTLNASGSQDLKGIAKKIGYPLLLKAAAGGGGKGMRRVNGESELESAAESASAEALSAFGEGTLFLERWLDRPRHIEIQVFGDGLGDGIHLFERECSLQRRHQKVWEEATAPRISAEARKRLFESALKLVKAVKYRNAGTLEFLMDDQENFYFLEMNTRLQVEHPVTEFVTGVDLVRTQIEQALSPDESRLPKVSEARGHAIEVRIYAEDPAQGYLPTPGKVERLRWPTGPGIRVDSGIEEGQEVGVQFDSMLGKLIVHGQTREHAIARMRYALEETVILGPGHNQLFLRALCDHPKVQSGEVDTGFLEREFATFSPNLSETELDLAAELRRKGVGKQSFAELPGHLGKNRYSSPWEVLGGFR